ncbi:translation initiation factor [Niveomyces insectorum RCEF 264]|uniref:Translation initiation factor n=1 Tax=Niveomyces insectorum RCEF 264 TaxID=1081102 RepID=A0A167YYM9_9HYPO|nr:translation initiation factor [Niveomyces insectorum RCEF 264]
MRGTACLSSPANALARVYSAGPSPHGVHFASSSFATSSANSCGSLLQVPRSLAPRTAAAWPLRAHGVFRPPPCRCLHSRAPIRRAPPHASAAAATATGLPPRPGPAAHGLPASRGHVRHGKPAHPHTPGGSSGSGGSGGGGGGGGGSNYNRNKTHAKFKLGRLPRDDEITHRYVILRQDDGSLSSPRLTASVLAGINRRKESLVVLALPAGEADAATRALQDEALASATGDATSTTTTTTTTKGNLRFPICKVVDRVAERKAQADKAKEQRRKSVAGKELELNWAIDPHDLGHRLAKLRSFLERGLRVEVTLLRKGKGKNRRQATREEAMDVVRRVRATVAEVPGARESKPMDGELLRTVKLYLERPTDGASASTPEEG